ncbi:TetR/AcrR family transcriptional regulator C-terminal domain-containing protein [Pseudonocardia yunnanensis]|uniref:TetR/AcrR family transcriptional regulator C-terminal domain-containing protein n=1 Tax=Pseudonocardia yunnanensis TaxID=58107 RepID=A0ABW4F6Z9_9PSEU
MKINREQIARTALGLLNDVGLDGLTMRLVAKELGVQAPALYWHVRNKQELLDAMATILFIEATERLELPGRDVGWAQWLGDQARGLRRTMLHYRDGARTLAGTNVTDPVIFRTIELTLRTLQDAGFSLRDAAQAVPAVLHYTIGFTIEEQARGGEAYDTDNPYDPEQVAARCDAERFPLTTQALNDLFDPDTDAGFEHGLQIILTGIRVTRFGA